jgi:hypothetical protein
MIFMSIIHYYFFIYYSMMKNLVLYLGNSRIFYVFNFNFLDLRSTYATIDQKLY